MEIRIRAFRSLHAHLANRKACQTSCEPPPVIQLSVRIFAMYFLPSPSTLNTRASYSSMPSKSGASCKPPVFPLWCSTRRQGIPESLCNHRALTMELMPTNPLRCIRLSALSAASVSISVEKKPDITAVPCTQAFVLGPLHVCTGHEPGYNWSLHVGCCTC